MIVLDLESFENNFLELENNFLDIKRKRVSMVKLSQGEEVFCMVTKYFFFEILAASIYQNTSESIRPCFRRKSDTSQQLLSWL